MKLDKIQKELEEIEKRKGTVWDERKHDVAYNEHRNALKTIEKKVDNAPPNLASVKFFPRMDYIAKQWKIEERIRSNYFMVRELNRIQRSRGTIDNLNVRSSYAEKMRKFKQREIELQTIEKYNKIYKNILAKTTPKVELTSVLLKNYYEKDRRSIFRSAKYKIVLECLKTPQMKRIEAPKGPRVFIDVLRQDEKFFGRLEILIFYDRVEKEVLRFFLDLCQKSYKDCFIHKIMKNLFIETGDVEREKVIYPRRSIKAPSHDRDGIVSLKLNKDGSLSPKLVITMQPMKILDANHIVIGRVINGNNFITDLDAHGTKFGVPAKRFFITVSSIKK